MPIHRNQSLALAALLDAWPNAEMTGGTALPFTPPPPRDARVSSRMPLIRIPRLREGLYTGGKNTNPVKTRAAEEERTEGRPGGTKYPIARVSSGIRINPSLCSGLVDT